MNQTSPFIKEILLVFLILLNCFFPLLHLIISDTSNSLPIFGFELNHGYYSNQSFAWFLFSNVQILVYLLLFFFCSKGMFKYAILPLIYWTIYQLFVCVTPIEIVEDMRLNLQFSAIFFSVLLILKSGNKKDVAKFRLFFSKSIWRLVLAFVLFALPFLQMLSYEFALKTNEIKFFGSTLTSRGFPDMASLLNYVFFKVYIIVPTVVYFYIIKRWWRYGLLLPLSIAFYQLNAAIDPNIEELDRYEIFEALPLLLFLMGLLVFLSKSAYYQSRLMQVYRLTQNQLEKVIRKKLQHRESFLRKTRAQLEDLKSGKTFKEEELLNLKRNLEQELESHSP